MTILEAIFRKHSQEKLIKISRNSQMQITLIHEIFGLNLIS
jgi:hypothetical protein